MTEKSIIVIGAGLAGLSAGCYAQMNGYRCHTFEHHSKPGGVAAAWKREGYLIDGGIHFLIGHRPGQPIFELYRELGIQTDDFPTLITYSRFIDEASGVSLDITGDLERLMHDLKAIAPADAGLIDDLVAGACAMQGSTILFEAGTGKPPELMNPLDLLRQFWSMRRTFKYFTGKYAKPLANYALAAHSQLLRQTLENLFLPEVPVWFVFMLMALLADGQIGLLPTGCRGFVMPIEERYKALGGTMTYEATVKEIIVEDDRAVGVSLIDGSTHRADVVISAADGHSTIFKMLGGRYVTKKTRERYCNWKLIRPVLMVSFGVAREFPDDPHMSFIILKDAITVGNQEIVGFSLRIFNYSTGFAPRGKTVVQVMLETEWDFWNDLQEDRQRYEAEKQRVAKKS